MVAALKLMVKGRVQRVGFRRYVLDLAQELGLSGYVKNLPDGSVEILIQGGEELVKGFLEALKKPPPPAIVREVLEEKAEPRPEVKEFKIIYGELAEELQEGFGAMQSIFTEYWREFRDYWGEFREYRQEFRDFRGEFREYRQEFREFVKRTDENFKLLFEKYGEISSKLTIILEALIRESKETREALNEALKLLREAVEKLSSRAGK
ncbi:MAG: acylphosphatase [Candidatus Nezhaarchaeota archaeon]|nr:acylphosphatase [Candidatus Nezhaarchaeota archaeon]